MKKNASRKNVIAPERIVKSRLETIRDYLVDIGFFQFGRTQNEWRVYAKAIPQTNAKFLFVFIKENFIRFYQGFHKDAHTKANKLVACTVNELNEVMRSLAKRKLI